MAYKFKPNKSVAKRLRLTKTGKLKRHHGFTSHLMSARSASKRRKLRQPAVLFEGHARNMRKLMGVGGLHPGKVAHERALEESAEESARESAPERKS
jgi:large subunit ribosomal protein L35